MSWFAPFKHMGKKQSGHFLYQISLCFPAALSLWNRFSMRTTGRVSKQNANLLVHFVLQHMLESAGVFFNMAGAYR